MDGPEHTQTHDDTHVKCQQNVPALDALIITYNTPSNHCANPNPNPS